MKPVNDFMKETVEKRARSFEDDNRDLEAVKLVEKMLKENKKHDIIFSVRGRKVQAHKHVLSFRSSYFSNMFSSKRKSFLCEF